MLIDEKKLEKYGDQNIDKLFPGLLTDDEKEAMNYMRKQQRKLRRKAQAGASKSENTSDASTHHSKTSVRKDGLHERLEDAEEETKKNLRDTLALGNAFDLHSLADNIIDPKTGKQRELVDVSSLPEAKNFYDYCFRILGSDIHAPWAVQMWLAMNALGEVCPRCTNEKYKDVRNIRKDFPSKNLLSEKRMTFLEHGVCPRCGATKYELMQSGELKPYNQAVFVLGQRCVDGETLVFTKYGMMHVSEILNFRQSGFSPFSTPLHNGKRLETPIFSYATPLCESLFCIRLSDGGILECTRDHPVMTSRGWIKAGDLIPGMTVECVSGTQCFGVNEDDEKTYRKIGAFIGGKFLIDFSESKKAEAMYILGFKNDRDRCIPLFVRQASKKCVCAFLRGAFFGMHDVMPQSAIRMQTASAKLVQELRAMLYNFGFCPTICMRGGEYEISLSLNESKDFFLLCSEKLSKALTRRSHFLPIVEITRTAPKRAYDFVMPETHQFLGNSIVNHNSGKSSTAALIASYVLHRYLMYPILASMTDSMQASTELVFVFCSLTYQKAYDVLWTPFKNIIDHAAWFASYFALLDSYKEELGGKDLYLNSKTVLSFSNKNIRCIVTGPTASKLRGNTSIMTMLDELGLFPLPDPKGQVSEDDPNRRANSDEAYTSLMNSLATVGAAHQSLLATGHNDAPPCLMLSVSSPISRRDKVMRLLQEAKHNPYIFAAQMATWEVNPFLERTSPLIASAFEADERKALRDFGAVPTESAAPFFSAQAVEQIFCGRPNSHVLTYCFDAKEHSVWGTVRRVNAYNAPTVLALDAGLVNNSFAVAVVGYNQQTQKTETVCVLEVMAKDGNSVNFESMYSNVIFPLCKQLNVCLVVADRWNSADHLHRIHKDMGMRGSKYLTKIKQYSLKHKDFEMVRALINNRSVTCPTMKPDLKKKILSGEIGDYKNDLFEHPVEHFFLQLLTITDLGPTMPPGKAEGFTDDIARAWVLAVTMVNNEKVIEWMDESRKYIQNSASQSQGRGVVISGRSFFY